MNITYMDKSHRRTDEEEVSGKDGLRDRMETDIRARRVELNALLAWELR